MKLLKQSKIVIQAAAILFLFSSCGDENNLGHVYHGQNQTVEEQPEIIPFPLKVGDRFVYQWQLTKQQDCINSDNEEKMQLFQCITISKIDETAPEVRVEAKTRFAINYPFNLSAEDYAHLKTIFAPNWFFKMLPDTLNQFNTDFTANFFTQRAPRPYQDLGSDKLDFTTLNIIELRQLKELWGGWSGSGQNNFRQEFSSHFVKNYKNTNYIFMNINDNNSSSNNNNDLYLGGYTWRETIDSKSALHALYLEYNYQGVLTNGEETIVFDNDQTTTLPSPQELVKQGCKYNDTYVLKVLENFSDKENLDYYWEKYCQE